MKSNFKLTRQTIERYATGSSFERGEVYFRQGRVGDLVIEEDVITATCEGSQDEPYSIEIMLGKNGIEEAFCDCEYDYGGYCKHIVAVLLAVAEETSSKKAGSKGSGLRPQLEAFSKEELVELVMNIVKRHPEARSIVQLTVPITQRGQLDLKVIREGLQRAFKKQTEWGKTKARPDIANAIKTAQKLSETGDWVGASEVYAVIVEECLAHLDELMSDGSGETYATAGDAVDHLAECLKRPEIVEMKERRQYILNLLMDTFVSVRDWDGFGDNVEEVILQYARPADIPALQKKLQEKITYLKSYRYAGNSTHLQEYSAQLGILHETDPAKAIQQLIQQGFYHTAAAKLIDLGQIDEAAELTLQNVNVAGQLIELIQRFEEANQPGKALIICLAKVKTIPDRYFYEWLVNYYQQSKDTASAIHWQMESFLHEPFLRFSTYKALRNVAGKSNDWQQLRARAIQHLTTQSVTSTIIEIYLDEHEWDKAWELAENPPTSRRQPIPDWEMDYRAINLKLEVAHVTESEYPAKAIAIYVPMVERFIRDANRKSYTQAAQYLKRMQPLYAKLNRSEDWLELVQLIRLENPKRRALLEEMEKAKL